MSSVAIWRVGPDFFSTLRTPIREGREFDLNEKTETTREVILSESAARVVCPGRCVGSQVSLHFLRTRADVDAENPRRGHGPPYWNVRAVVSDVKIFGLTESGPPAVYLDYRSLAEERALSRPRLVVRVDSSDLNLQGHVREAIESVPRVALLDLIPLQHVLQRSLGAFGNQALMATGGVLTAGLSIALAFVGIYLSIAAFLSATSRDLAIRRSLGAPVGSLLIRTLTWVIAAAVAGLTLGSALGVVTVQRMEALFVPGERGTVTVLVLSLLLLSSVVVSAVLFAVSDLRRQDLSSILKDV